MQGQLEWRIHEKKKKTFNWIGKKYRWLEYAIVNSVSQALLWLPN